MTLSTSTKRVTAEDVARLAGVHRTCVSVVLNGAKSNIGVSAEVREKILAAAAELNYRPSAAAQALATGRTMQIAVLASDGARPAVGRYPDVRGMIEVAAQHDFRVVVLPVHDDERGTQQLENVIRDRVCDGICLFSDQLSEAQLDVLRRHPMPCVLIGDEPASRGGGDLEEAVRIDFDNYRYAYDATTWLTRQGHRRIAYIKNIGEGQQPHSIALRRGFVDGMAAAGLGPVEEFYEPRLEPAPIVEFAREAGYSALLIHNLCDALRWGRALRGAGFKLPDDMTLMTLTDHTEMCSHFMDDWNTELACSTHNWTDLARTATEVLVRWIKGESPERRTILMPARTPGWAHEVRSRRS